MIEWQNESSLFTIRVQGKQWYWVYKYDATAAQSILAAPKNIGHNRWFVSTPFESYCADTYYQALHLGAQLEFNQLYLKLLGDNQLSKQSLEANNLINQNIVSKAAAETAAAERTYRVQATHSPYSNAPLDRVITRQELELQGGSNYVASLFVRHDKEVLDGGHFEYTALEDTQNFAANLIEKVAQKPLRFARGILNEHTLELLEEERRKCDAINFWESLLINDEEELPVFDLDTGEAIGYRMYSRAEIEELATYSIAAKFLLDESGELQGLEKRPILFVAQFENNADGLTEKVNAAELLWGFRQKKYKRLQKFKFSPGAQYDPVTFRVIGKNAPKSSLTLKSNIFQEFMGEEVDSSNNYNYQRAIKYNRHRSELVPVGLARRLLRTKRTLVLPAHTNITVVTNSYDVVHSWFIPGLGIKMDCVPGRSTHHTFYIDNIGFYYGQCAEICGRYHHHMPIRLCALPFEQFLVWWQKKGLKRMHRVATIKNDKIADSNQIKFRYQW